MFQGNTNFSVLVLLMICVIVPVHLIFCIFVADYCEVRCG